MGGGVGGNVKQREKEGGAVRDGVGENRYKLGEGDHNYRGRMWFSGLCRKGACNGLSMTCMYSLSNGSGRGTHLGMGVGIMCLVGVRGRFSVCVYQQLCNNHAYVVVVCVERGGRPGCDLQYRDVSSISCCMECREACLYWLSQPKAPTLYTAPKPSPCTYALPPRTPTLPARIRMSWYKSEGCRVGGGGLGWVRLH